MSGNIHPIDRVIGERRRSAEDIVRDLTASDQFRELVSEAVAHSSDPGTTGSGPTFAAQLRQHLAEALCPHHHEMPEGVGAGEASFPMQTPLG